ncbi:transposase [Parafrankia elaeagni]|uniref:transposase n=1 Tax=Parafrankia elaeagni TaxID=222534 RepID=UPI0003A5EEDD
MEETLGSWVATYRRAHAGAPPPPTADESTRLRELERQNRELLTENQFPKKAAAYFAPRIIGERHVRVHRCGVRHPHHREPTRPQH